LVMYDELSQNAISTGSSTNGAVTAVTGAEVANYIQAQQAKNKTYAKSDLTLSDDTGESVYTYSKAMSALGNSPFDQDFVTHLTSYIQGKESKDTYIGPKLVSINQLITKLLAIPVPPTAIALHLSVLNSLYGLEQTIDGYDSTTTDSLAQLGTTGLAQGYIRDTITGVANMNAYFSVAITPTNSPK